MSRLAIYLGIVKSVTEEGILVYIETLKDYGFCAFKNLTDFEENKQDLIELETKKKFVILKKHKETDKYLNLSYKYIHPEEQKFKKQTIPTSSHFYNLHSFLNNKLDLEFFFNKKVTEFQVEKFQYLLNKK